MRALTIIFGFLFFFHPLLTFINLCGRRLAGGINFDGDGA
jgi:hypothetical protein